MGKEKIKKYGKIKKEDIMRKLLDLKLYGLMAIVTFALVFIVFTFGQGQVKTLGKPDKPGGKPKGSGTPMDAISTWLGCDMGFVPVDPFNGPSMHPPQGSAPNLLLIDTRDYIYPRCWNGGADVPVDTNRSFIIDFNWNPCMHYSEMEINVPQDRKDYDWQWLFRGEMSAIRNEIGEIVEIKIWFYDQDGWGYETETIGIDNVMPNPDYFVISVCRTDIPIFPRGHKQYWKDWFIEAGIEDGCLGEISIGEIHFIPRPPRSN